eukprot:gene3918-4892_t
MDEESILVYRDNAIKFEIHKQDEFKDKTFVDNNIINIVPDDEEEQQQILPIRFINSTVNSPNTTTNTTTTTTNNNNINNTTAPPQPPLSPTSTTIPLNSSLLLSSTPLSPKKLNNLKPIGGSGINNSNNINNSNLDQVDNEVQQQHLNINNNNSNNEERNKIKFKEKDEENSIEFKNNKEIEEEEVLNESQQQDDTNSDEHSLDLEETHHYTSKVLEMKKSTGNEQDKLKSMPPLNLGGDSDSTTAATNTNSTYSSIFFPYPCLDNLQDELQQQSQQQTPKKQPTTIYYYQLIAQYFLNNPDQVESYRPLLYTLWTSGQWFYLIYSSLFYMWLLEYRLSLIPQLNIFIKATNRLFWYDKDHNTTKYTEIYMTIKRKLLDRSLWNGINETTDENNSNLTRNRRIWVDFYHIISVFYFYYEHSTDGLEEFRKNISQQYQDYILDPLFLQQQKIQQQQQQNNNNDSLDHFWGVLSVDDIFVRGVIRHLSLIKHEEILIRYIDRCIVFKDWSLNPTTKVKLQSCLYSLTKPGSPAYVPRSVRIASRNILDQLFPEGRLSRYTVNLFFRLLHPYYSAGSIIHWLYSTVKSYIPDNFYNINSNNSNGNQQQQRQRILK